KYIDHMIESGPIIAMVLEGNNAISAIRKMHDTIHTTKNAVGTIRYDYAIHTMRNMVHASSSVDEAKKEISLWFKPDEIVDQRVDKPMSAFMYAL
ncbi:MAG: hypothetical protein MHPSP_004610, partial [Paramarteilia canceri]